MLADVDPCAILNNFCFHVYDSPGINETDNVIAVVNHHPLMVFLLAAKKKLKPVENLFIVIKVELFKVLPCRSGKC